MLDRTMASWAGTLVFVLQQLAIEAANWLVDHQRPQEISFKVCCVRALSVSRLSGHFWSHVVTCPPLSWQSIAFCFTPSEFLRKTPMFYASSVGPGIDSCQATWKCSKPPMDSLDS